MGLDVVKGNAAWMITPCVRLLCREPAERPLPRPGRPGLSRVVLGAYHSAATPARSKLPAARRIGAAGSCAALRTRQTSLILDPGPLRFVLGETPGTTGR